MLIRPDTLRGWRALVSVGATAAAFSIALTGCASPAADAPTAGPSYAGGPITEAEYVTIVRSVRECMVRMGYDADEVDKQIDGLTYGFTVSGGSVTDGNALDDRLACEAQFGLMEAEIAFQDQHALTGAEREARLVDFSACMDAAGIPGITSADTASDVQDAIAALAAGGADEADAVSCWTQYSSALYGSAG